MTESELWELIVTYNGNAMTGITIYFSALTGYLIVAYMIGSRLTVMQSAIITVGFVIFQLLMIFATIGLVTRAVFLIGKTTEEYRSGIMVSDSFALVLLLFLFGGIVAALKFMWDVRNKKFD